MKLFKVRPALLRSAAVGIWSSLGFAWMSTAAMAGPSEGQAIYESFCVVCHGGIGEGETMGKPLVDNVARNLSDADLIGAIINGRPGTGMAAYGNALSAVEVRDVAGYIRVLQGGTGLADGDGDGAAEASPQVVLGEALFAGKAACVDCHSYRGKGGTAGPALDGVAGRLGAEKLREAVEAPSRTIVSGYGVKVLETTDGQIIRGRYRNESEQAIQILSEDGRRWVTQFKRNLKSIRDSEESLMPDTFAGLGAEEQAALLAFLNSL
jgi:cytochrome c oxidase cbb3-type subunit III